MGFFSLSYIESQRSWSLTLVSPFPVEGPTNIPLGNRAGILSSTASVLLHVEIHLLHFIQYNIIIMYPW